MLRKNLRLRQPVRAEGVILLRVRRKSDDRQSDAHPGGHAKWVQNPHGLATVSGERRTAKVGTTLVSGPSLGHHLGRRRRVASIRESGNRHRGVLIHAWGAGRSPVFPAPAGQVQSLHLSVPFRSSRPRHRRAITGHVTVQMAAMFRRACRNRHLHRPPSADRRHRPFRRRHPGRRPLSPRSHQWFAADPMTTCCLAMKLG